MRSVYTRVCFILICSLFAQPYATSAQVSVTASSGTPTGSYTTLKLAFDAVNSGVHQGVIGISITGSTTETASAVLNGSGGFANYVTVTITPTVTATIEGNLPAPLIDLNGADSVVIDGRIGATGSTRSLTVRNNYSTATGGTAYALRLVNGARRNMLRYVIFEGLSQGQTLNSTIVIAGTNNGSRNSYNTIHNNEVRPVGAGWQTKGIWAAASPSYVDSFNAITNNLVHNFYCADQVANGIYLENASHGYTVSRNSVYQTASIPGTSMYGPSFIGIIQHSGIAVSHNYIGGSAALTGGAKCVYPGGNNVIGIYLWGGVSGLFANNIDSNIITNFQLGTSVQGGTLSCIKVDGRLCKIGTTYGNIIGSTTDTGVVRVYGQLVGIATGYSTSIEKYDIQNNKIGGLSAHQAPFNFTYNEARLTGISCVGDTVNVTNNVVGSDVPGSIKIFGGTGGLTGIEVYGDKKNPLHCSFNTIKNLNDHTTGTTLSTVTGIMSAPLPNNDTNFVHIDHNQISDLYAVSPSISSLYGIYTPASALGPQSRLNAIIHNNHINHVISSSTGANSTVSGINIETPYSHYMIVDSNHIHDFSSTVPNTSSATTTALQGIRFYSNSDTTATIASNRIYDLSSTTTAAVTVTGIFTYYLSDTNALRISKNQVYALKNIGTGGTATGVSIGGPGSGTFAVDNNMISLSTPDAALYGLHINADVTQVFAYYNSVYVRGVSTSALNSAALHRPALSNTTLTMSDNIYQNMRVGGTGGHYAIMNEYATPSTGWQYSNFNDIFSNNSATAVLWGSTQLSFTGYQAASLQDSCSKNLSPDFVDAPNGDLHLINNSVNLALAGKMVPTFTTDFDGNARNAFPTIGADELLVPFQGVTVTPAGPIGLCEGDSVTLEASIGTDIQWYFNGAAIGGATSSQLPIGDSGIYYVVYDDGCLASISPIVDVDLLTTYDTFAVTICGNQSYILGSQTLTTSGTYFDVFTNVALCDSNVTIILDVIPTNDTVNVSGYTLTADAAGATYQWVDCDNNYADIAGATNQSYTATATGAYALIVTNNGCTDTSACFTITIAGIDGPGMNAANLYPNPGKDVLTITMARNLTGGAITISNQLGQVVDKIEQLEGKTFELDMRAYQSGLYIIELTDSGNTYRCKWIKGE